MNLVSLTDEESLGRIVDQHETVLIYFWAPWCTACKGFLPVLERASDRNPDIPFCRVNTGEQKQLARSFDVRSIPTLVAIRDRILIASQSGVLPEPVVEELISKVRALDMDELRREMAEAEATEGR